MTKVDTRPRVSGAEQPPKILGWAWIEGLSSFDPLHAFGIGLAISVWPEAVLLLAAGLTISGANLDDDGMRVVGISHNQLGDLAVATGDLTAARTAYQTSLDIAIRLAAATPPTPSGSATCRSATTSWATWPGRLGT